MASNIYQALDSGGGGKGWRVGHEGRARARVSGGGRGLAVNPKPKLLGPARLYNKLVKAGIAPDHWQMHATREVLVSKLLTKDGRAWPIPLATSKNAI